MSRQDGGPAFPVEGHFYGPQLGGSLFHGMTLRDYFAAAALTGLCSMDVLRALPERTMAEWAYKQADEMLKAREVPDEPGC